MNQWERFVQDRRAVVLSALLACQVPSMGCELIATVDRSRIPVESGSSGTGSGGGGGGSGAGGSEGCTTANDCPGTDGVCQTRTCVARVCGLEYLPSGTRSDTQASGDCRVEVCDGMGALVLAPDDTDVPVDPSDCTLDQCSAGKLESVPLLEGTACSTGSGKVCDGMGACVACAAPSDCSSGVCMQNTCVPPSCADQVKNGDETDVNCGGSCPACDLGKACGKGLDCASSVCVSSVCVASLCGDGKITGAETCDDGNTTAGDCCSAACSIETASGCEIEPNDTDATANDWSQISFGGKVLAFHAPASDTDVFSIVVPAGYQGTLAATVTGGALGSQCVNPMDIDSYLTVRDAAAATIGSNDDINFQTNRCSSVTLSALLPGTYYVEHTRTKNNPTGKATYDYTLGIDLSLAALGSCGNGMLETGETCDDGNQVSLDGCSGLCAREADYHCSGSAPSVCLPYESRCDDGADNDGDGQGDATDTDCQIPPWFPGCGAGEAKRVYKAFDTPIVVPDNEPTGAESTLFVVDDIGSIARAAVVLNVTHTYMADVSAKLVHPGFAAIPLTIDNGGAGGGYIDTVFDSTCSTNISAGSYPYSDCYAPEAPLTPLNGSQAQGPWSLRVVDNFAGDTGTLDAWTLVLCIAAP